VLFLSWELGWTIAENNFVRNWPNASDRHAGVWRASFAVAPDFAYDLFMTPSANTP
jgi:hypothetical protein